MQRNGFLAGEVVFLVVAQLVGGLPWTLVGGVAFVLLGFAGPCIEAVLLAAPSLGWLGASIATGNRELFFPYAMHLAAVALCRLATRGVGVGLAGGGVVAAAFLAIRVAQQATPRVLAVESAVAAAILAGVAFARARLPQGGIVDAAIVAGAALLACAGLAVG
ncbi:MAG: hypothetical protein ACKOSQ_01515 [Planctomycetaceae bacterium]